MAAQDSEEVRIDGHRIALTHLDKVMYPETGTTKRDVIDYYSAVADVMIPHVRDRIATRKRWVDGVGTPEHPGQVFFQKNLDQRSTPSWVRQREFAHKNSVNSYPLVNDRATLIWLAQTASLELHVPQWRVGRWPGFRNPDRFVIDLDPGEGVTLADCAEVARLAKAILSDMGLSPVPVTSGSKGIHLYAGLDGSQTGEQVAAVAHELARALEADHADLVVSDMKKALRAGKVLIDWSQNNPAKTTVAPYSLRGRFRPTVAVPRTWRELASKDLRHLELGEVLQRVKRRGDPLAGLAAGRSAGRLDEEELHEEVGRERPRERERVEARSAAPAVRSAAPGSTARGSAARGSAAPGSAAPVSAVPVSPMLATLGSAADISDESEWAFEMKWDGIRAVAEVRDGRVRLTTRNGNDVTVTYPELAGLADLADGHELVLDGEVVTLDRSGRPDFGLLQTRMGLTRPADVQSALTRAPAHYMVFDILELDGADQRKRTYEERRETLLATLTPPPDDPIQVPPAFDGDLAHAIASSRDLGLEGVMAKQRDSTYATGRRSRAWIKIKHHMTQEVVIGGWTPGTGRRASTIGALLLGLPDGDGLRYVGKVGTGFSDAVLDELRDMLARIETPESPLRDVPRPDARSAHWVRPEYVGEVEFAEWTSTDRLRQPSWRGLRPDKAVEQVVREG